MFPCRNDCLAGWLPWVRCAAEGAECSQARGQAMPVRRQDATRTARCQAGSKRIGRVGVGARTRGCQISGTKGTPQAERPSAARINRMMRAGVMGSVLACAPVIGPGCFACQRSSRGHASQSRTANTPAMLPHGTAPAVQGLHADPAADAHDRAPRRGDAKKGCQCGTPSPDRDRIDGETADGGLCAYW